MPLVDSAAATASSPASISARCASARAAEVSMPSATSRWHAVAGSPQSTAHPAALWPSFSRADFFGSRGRPSAPAPSSALPAPPARRRCGAHARRPSGATVLEHDAWVAPDQLRPFRPSCGRIVVGERAPADPGLRASAPAPAPDRADGRVSAREQIISLIGRRPQQARRIHRLVALAARPDQIMRDRGSRRRAAWRPRTDPLDLHDDVEDRVPAAPLDAGAKRPGLRPSQRQDGSRPSGRGKGRECEERRLPRIRAPGAPRSRGLERPVAEVPVGT